MKTSWARVVSASGVWVALAVTGLMGCGVEADGQVGDDTAVSQQAITIDTSTQTEYVTMQNPHFANTRSMALAPTEVITSVSSTTVVGGFTPFVHSYGKAYMTAFADASLQSRLNTFKTTVVTNQATKTYYTDVICTDCP